MIIYEPKVDPHPECWMPDKSIEYPLGTIWRCEYCKTLYELTTNIDAFRPYWERMSRLAVWRAKRQGNL